MFTIPQEYINSGMAVIMEATAPFVARAIAKHLPDKARQFAQEPKEIVGWKVPPELERALGGGVAGLTFAELVKKLVPGISSSKLDYVSDYAAMISVELGHVLREQEAKGSTSSGSTPQGAGKVPMATTPIYRPWFVDMSKPSIAVCGDCNAAHHMELKVPTGPAPRAGQPQPAPQPVIRTGYFIRTFPDVLASGAHAPADAAQGLVLGCLCPVAFTADKAIYDQAQQPAATPGAAPKPGEPTKSFVQLEFEVYTEAKAKSDQEMLDAIADLTALLGQFVPAELHDLIYCNTQAEYKVLAMKAHGAQAIVATGNRQAIEAKKAQFIPFLQHLRANQEVGKLEAMLGEVGALATPAKRFIAQEPRRIEESRKRGEELATKLAERAAVRRYAATKGTTLEAVRNAYLGQIGQPIELDAITSQIVDQMISACPEIVKTTTNQPKRRWWITRALLWVVTLPWRIAF